MVIQPKSFHRDTTLKLVGALIPVLPFLGYRLLREYLCFKASASKAGKIYEQELIKQGLSLDIAHELTMKYLESQSLQTALFSR